MLEEALQNFEGTVIMVSHDRFFLSQTANTIVALEDQVATTTIITPNHDPGIEGTRDTTTPGAQRVRRRLPDIHGAQRGCEGEDRGPLH